MNIELSNMKQIRESDTVSQPNEAVQQAVELLYQRSNSKVSEAGTRKAAEKAETAQEKADRVVDEAKEKFQRALLSGDTKPLKAVWKALVENKDATTHRPTRVALVLADYAALFLQNNDTRQAKDIISAGLKLKNVRASATELLKELQKELP